MRLIDADVFNKKLIREINKSGKYTPYECGLDDAAEYLEEQPTIDAVEVVRCEDCKHCSLDLVEKGDVLCRRTVIKNGQLIPLNLEMAYGAFCSYGERKGGDNEHP